MNERRTLARVIREAKKLQPGVEIIAVVNGSTDGSENIARVSGARVIFYEQPLGHDVGRSVGARYASGDVLLFLDGDMVIPAQKLRPFIYAVERGVDVALNRYIGPTRLRSSAHPVVLAKHALNTAIGRADLRGASMTTIPHAVSRKALDAIGIENLAVPPKAQAMAVQKQLRVEAVHFIHVGLLNPVRRRGNRADPLGRLIVGDHLEALRWYTQSTNDRGLHTDLNRNRNMVR
ncbi:glycosyltransferase family 2 protein [Paenibacillus konkukensis]